MYKYFNADGRNIDVSSFSKIHLNEANSPLIVKWFRYTRRSNKYLENEIRGKHE